MEEGPRRIISQVPPRLALSLAETPVLLLKALDLYPHC